MEFEGFINRVELAVFLPGYVKIKGESFDEELLKQKFIDSSPCKSIIPTFFFSEVYTEKVSTFRVTSQSIPKEVKIEYKLSGSPREFKVKPEIYLSVLREKKPIKVKNEKGESFILVPIAISAVIENAPTSIDDLIAIPFFLAWENGCGEINSDERTHNPFVFQLEKALEEILGFELAISNRGRFFIVSMEVNWEKVQNALGENASVDELIKTFPKEFYGLAVTDEGYRAVREDYARERVTGWLRGNRVYFSKLVSPVSIIQVNADRNRVEFEETTLPKCRIWKDYVLKHLEEKRKICHHGLFHQAEYLALTFSTIETFKSLTKTIIEEAKKHRNSNARDIEKILRAVEDAKVQMESSLKTLNPGNISRIPESTTVIERMYEARGLSSFSSEVKEALESLTAIMAEGNELIDKHMEREKFQHLEMGVTLLEALPIGYVLQWIFQFFGINIPTAVFVGATMPLLLALWWLYKSKKIHRWEKEQVNNFMKMAENILDSLF